MTAHVSTARAADDDIVELVKEALNALVAHRGGQRLFGDITHTVGASEPIAMTERLIRDDGLVVATWDASPVAVAAVGLGSRPTLLGVYVTSTHRRRGLGRSLVQWVIESPHHVVDAWALPGDRAMKSLYESVGWKARRLTMSGE
jgi:GNAT superfamily N-acetyltransferase